MPDNIENQEQREVKNKKVSVVGIIVAFVLAIMITFFKTNDVLSKAKTPIEAYRVYLKGNSIGLIKSDKELYDYINEMQQEIKKKYKVDNVYVPSDINVVKDVTYEENLQSIAEIYNIINEKSPFTIKGYVAKIDKTNSVQYTDDTKTEEEQEEEKKESKIVKINILDKEIFKNAIKKVMLSFVSEEEYNNYANETQSPITTTGEIIETLYPDARFVFTDSYISVNEKIYMSEDELTEYLLFGEDNNMSSYTVKEGDTLASVANANKMNVNEILIANSNLGSENALLYEGQKLTVGVLDPVISTVEVTTKVEDQVINYKTEYVYDNAEMMGYQRVETPGSNGVTRVTQKIQSINGQVVQALISNKEEIKPVVNEVIVKGGKRPVVVSAGNWGWPTNIPYIITSNFGWRWGRMHDGVDIGGCGYGSPIYAAKDGIVTEVSYHYATGYYVVIDHQNGYYTRYGHMVGLSRYVKVGDHVKMGDTIGDMGSSGNTTGTHLHFEIWTGKPYAGGSQNYDPLLFY